MNKSKILIIIVDNDVEIGLQVYLLQISARSKDLSLHFEERSARNDTIGPPQGTEHHSNPDFPILSLERAPEAWQILMN